MSIFFGVVVAPCPKFIPEKDMKKKTTWTHFKNTRLVVCSSFLQGWHISSFSLLKFVFGVDDVMIYLELEHC